MDNLYDLKFYRTIKALYKDASTTQLALRLVYLTRMGKSMPLTIKAIANILLQRQDAKYLHRHCRSILNSLTVNNSNNKLEISDAKL